MAEKKEKPSISSDDIKSLEMIFALARKQVCDNEQELIAVINYKQSLFEKLNSYVEDKSLKKAS